MEVLGYGGTGGTTKKKMLLKTASAGIQGDRGDRQKENAFENWYIVLGGPGDRGTGGTAKKKIFLKIVSAGIRGDRGDHQKENAFENCKCWDTGGPGGPPKRKCFRKLVHK